MIYLLGIVVAMTLGLVLRHRFFKNKEQTALLMELPPYHRPHWRTVCSHTWERIASFLQNALSLILVTSLVLWLLMAIPTGAQAWRAGLPLGQDGHIAFAHTSVD